MPNFCTLCHLPLSYAMISMCDALIYERLLGASHREFLRSMGSRFASRWCDEPLKQLVH